MLLFTLVAINSGLAEFLFQQNSKVFLLISFQGISELRQSVACKTSSKRINYLVTSVENSPGNNVAYQLA